MQALELEVEEMESLVQVGNGQKSRKKAKPVTMTEQAIGTCTQNKNFIRGVLGVALVLLLMILFLSTEEAAEEGNGITVQKPHHEANAPSPAGVDNNNDSGNSDGEGTPDESNGSNGDGKPDENGDSKGNGEGGDSNKAVTEEDNYIYLYSKFATIIPLPDQTPLSEKERDELVEKFGKWSFWDGDEDMRSDIAEEVGGNMYEKYPNRDVDEDGWPDEAWQGDAVFVNHYLDAADKMLGYIMEAIFTEYGYGKPLPPEMFGERMKMFHWDKMKTSDFADANEPPNGGNKDYGGWTTEESWSSFVRRLLHAMTTSDTFTVVVAGDSKAAGYGNHFRQSYSMQFYKVIYPLMARLGVKLVVRNMAQAGNGTIHQDMGFASIYGDDIDLFIWDSNSKSQEHMDLMMRQALLSGKRVPMIWGGDFELLKELHDSVNANIGQMGQGTYGIKETTSASQVEELPYAARFMKCSDDAKKVCEDESPYCANCWIPRDDGVTPKAKQLDQPPGQKENLPGWREHQLQGRVLAFAFLSAIQDAVNEYQDGVMGGPPLDDEEWHLTGTYDDVRERLKNLDKSKSKCHNIQGIPTRMCDVPMKARTQYTPRVNPDETSLVSIIKAPEGGSAPSNDKELLYEGPDAPNSCMKTHDGDVDVYAVASGRRRRLEVGALEVPPGSGRTKSRSLADESIKPGKGWQVVGEKYGVCDGTYRNVCGRSTDEDCVLSGYHDSRGAVIGNEYSGWLVMTLKDLVEGIIVIKLHTWHLEDENTVTKDWTSVNNESERRQLRTEPSNNNERKLERDYKMPDLPDTFQFEYAVDGKITTLNKEDFDKKLIKLEDFVDVMTVLDDEKFTSSAKDVELAIRMLGCERKCTFGLSHVYWA